MSHETKLRSVMVVGKTGSGKSWLLNKLIGKSSFKSNAGIESCTDQIQMHSIEIDTTFTLNCYDTPGIADTQGRSKSFLNEIAKKIKTTDLNMLIVLVEYGKHDPSFYVNLEVLKECVNHFEGASTVIVINKVPTEQSLNKKRENGENVPDRATELDETFEKISKILDISALRYSFFLENEELIGFIGENQTDTYKSIKSVIESCGSLMSKLRVRSWDDIFDLYSREIDQLTSEQLDSNLQQLVSDYSEKIAKVEFDMADLKYSFLD